MTDQAQLIARVFDLLEQDSLASADVCMQAIDAVKTVSTQMNKCAIEIEYDQCRISYSQIHEHLRQQGFALKSGWLDRIKLHWFDYLDTIARENASAPPPACCNKPPKQH